MHFYRKSHVLQDAQHCCFKFNVHIILIIISDNFKPLKNKLPMFREPFMTSWAVDY